MPDEGDFSLKDLMLQVVLPTLRGIDAKLDLKADKSEVAELKAEQAKLEGRFDLLEKHGSPVSQAAVQRTVAQDEVLGDLQTWSNRQKGALAIIAPALMALGTAVLHKYGVL